MSVLTVTTPARDRFPVERATVKSELGISGTSEDSKIDRLILAVARILEGDSGIGRPVWRQTYQEKLAGHGGHFLSVSRFPIEAISSIDLDGSTIDSDLYEVWGEYRDMVYRETGWLWTPRRLSWLAENPVPGSEAYDYEMTYTGGWIMPGQAVEWAATTPKVEGDFVKATTHSFGDMYFEAGGAGTTGGSEPTWPTTVGGTVVDNDITWTAREAVELPEDLQEAALGLAIALYRDALERDPAISAEEFDRQRIEYHDELVSGVISTPVEQILAAYR